MDLLYIKVLPVEKTVKATLVPWLGDEQAVNGFQGFVFTNNKTGQGFLKCSKPSGLKHGS
ncbi:MAG: hypothetical protein H6573_30730 [Lewinellaceae bacterium]|nr:hypothetical protein [Lewinellaceae bacterium]